MKEKQRPVQVNVDKYPTISPLQREQLRDEFPAQVNNAKSSLEVRDNSNRFMGEVIDPDEPIL